MSNNFFNASYLNRKARRPANSDQETRSTFLTRLPAVEKAKRWTEERNSQRDNDSSWDYDK